MAHIKRLNALHETAALWHERVVHENASAEIRGALNSWLNESSAHAAAFQAVERTWGALKSAAQDPAVLELRQEAAQRLTPTTSESHRPPRWAVAALIILF